MLEERKSRDERAVGIIIAMEGDRTEVHSLKLHAATGRCQAALEDHLPTSGKSEKRIVGIMKQIVSNYRLFHKKILNLHLL